MTLYVALMPSTEASLMMTESSVASQSELGDIGLEYWLRSLNRSSPLAAALSTWLSCTELVVS